MSASDSSKRMRNARSDLTNYVVHLTRCRYSPLFTPFEVLKEILRTGFIKPTFAPYTKKSRSGGTRPGIKGPYAAVCLTEQPLSELIRTLEHTTRYQGYGIAYYKPLLYEMGARPVIYASEDEIGRKIPPGEKDWEEGKEIYAGGLPRHLQYLWSKYDPTECSAFNYKIDFTWEREWRVPFPNPRFKSEGLPVVIRNPWTADNGFVIVSKESEVPELHALITEMHDAGVEWTKDVCSIVSLDKAEANLLSDTRYAKLDTWPDIH